jgi:hypothetical protein
LDEETCLDKPNKTWEIQRTLLEEDKAIDALTDEQFPGMLFTRMKLYSRDPDPKDKWDKTIFKGWDDLDEDGNNKFYKEYLLQMHLYIGRNFPPADATGAADPFVVARSMGCKTRSRVKNETLNPGWFETLEMVIKLPPVGDPDFPSAGLSCLIYDMDYGLFGESKDLLGRIWIDYEKIEKTVNCPLDNSPVKIHTRKEEDWYDMIFDATGAKEGKLLIAYDLIPFD